MRIFFTRGTRSIGLVALLLSVFAGGLVVQNVSAQKRTRARLYLVSVGNGDPDNITLRAINTIKDSDIVFCSKRIRDKFPILLQGKEIFDPGFGLFAIYGKKPEEAKKNKRFDYEKQIRQLDEIR
jgi:precorrin-4/cobalt-precorrin-4 C11-methyltransferase